MKLQTTFLSLVFSITGQNIYANTSESLQLFDKRPITQDKLQKREGRAVSISVKISKAFCDDLENLRQEAPHYSSPEFSEYRKKANKARKLCSLSVSKNDVSGKLSSITLKNTSSDLINPTGTDTFQGATREYTFQFEQQARQEMKLSVADNSALTGKVTSDYLYSSLTFIPRLVIPYVETNEETGNCSQTVFLPTGEPVVFDSLSKEIIGGVLSELPIDLTESRHSRKFAKLEYTGKGIVIRADRRGGTPEMSHSVSWNSNEKISDALISYQDKTCIVSKDKIWKNTRNGDLTQDFKYATDQEFLDKVIKPNCNWDIEIDDLI
jgi:hypothetical protein